MDAVCGGELETLLNQLGCPVHEIKFVRKKEAAKKV
jgi:hypothetical protein